MKIIFSLSKLLIKQWLLVMFLDLFMDEMHLINILLMLSNWYCVLLLGVKKYFDIKNSFITVLMTVVKSFTNRCFVYWMLLNKISLFCPIRGLSNYKKVIIWKKYIAIFNSLKTCQQLKFSLKGYVELLMFYRYTWVSLKYPGKSLFFQNLSSSIFIAFKAWKVSKYGPEITPYLDAFLAVIISLSETFLCFLLPAVPCISQVIT